MIEYLSAGGFADPPASLLREGLAMRNALLGDLTRLPELRLRVAADPRFPPPPAGVRRLPVEPGTLAARLPALAAAAGRVWLIAPETGGLLARLAACVEAAGGRLAGSPAEAIRRAADKIALSGRLMEAGVPAPRSWPAAEARAAVRAAGFPLVVKPSPGAGCQGVRFVTTRRQLDRAVAEAAALGGEAVVQEWLQGRAAGAALLVAGGRALPLALGAQRIRPGPAGPAGRPLAYRGGVVPLRGPAVAAALRAAARACEAIPALTGWVGVDLVLGESGPAVIEVNPRLTTTYVGLRAATRANLAALALRAAGGELPPGPPALRRRVRFGADGRSQPA